MLKRSWRRGFTVVEVLTVMAVVVIATVLVLPAIQRSRADARETRCKYHLKQIGLALHNYHETYVTFPPGWTNGHSEPAPDKRFGWVSAALPFLDQIRLYNELDFDEPNETSQALLKTALPVVRCPSDPTPAVNSLRGSWGTANYSGNFGSEPLPRWAPSDYSGFWPGQSPTPTTASGLFYLNSRVRIRDIRDGTVNTIMVGERCVDSRAGLWFGVRGNEFEDDQVTDCSPGNEINSGDSGYSSFHGGGANFLLVDGSVNFISEDIDSREGTGRDMGVYQRISSRSDGVAVPRFYEN